jgi:hypothetical protein
MSQTMKDSSASQFAKIRAATNTTQIGLSLQNYHDAEKYRGENPTLAKELAANGAALQSARQEAEKLERAPAKTEVQDNRGKLREAYNNQTNIYVGKTMSQSRSNWTDVVEPQPQNKADRNMHFQQFNSVWFEKNKLANEDAKRSDAMARIQNDPLTYRNMMPENHGAKSSDAGVQTEMPSSAKVAQGKQKEELSLSNAQQQKLNGSQSLEFTTESSVDQAFRYKELYTRQQTAQTMTGNNGIVAGGQTNAAPPPAAQPAYVPQKADFGLPQSSDTTTINTNRNGEHAVPYFQANPSNEPPIAGERWDADTETLNMLSRARSVQGGVPALPSSGLASLDLRLPFDDTGRWSIHRFTTPLGEVEITARSVSDQLLYRSGYVAGLLAVLVPIVLLLWRGARHDCRKRNSSTPLLLVVLGLLSILLGVLPMLGIIAIIAGIAIKIAGMGKEEATASRSPMNA